MPFSTILQKKLAQSMVASTTETTVYTAPASTTTIVTQIVIANVTTTSATTSLSLVPSGGAAGDGNRLYKDMNVPANSITVIDLKQVMATGDFISVKQGTASACTTTISGVETT